ncbi:hypothetical protein PACID_14660 [Acidipropionibacterium acidipropionici ATCC 4875]|uniref:Uncharacterized protein n=1 Tax=Acidipropionibacterium acidipropionici (strain ATCC 4875 / DSM 20272 / JCM 6432 / NBRC 12425 / NCIMB 8070 / 4) TaxID=1171373 RepID=K7SJ37_ACIA4|nr:hypothetical protein [Acidipropionibacterium acidipropionici]AFV89280.1 hypothetical protein PACID_14660 [Acidipropionibacterium acidipropionici ATCC 4875]
MSSDGIEESLEGQFRTAITAASRLVEQLARTRQAQRERDEQMARHRTREDEQRHEAERRSARAEMEQTKRREWWHAARPDHVAHAVATAEAWAEHDPAFRQDADRLHREVTARYGVDPQLLPAQQSQLDRSGVQTVRDQLERTIDPAWWEQAQPLDVAHAVATAEAWAEHDPAFQDHADRLHREVAQRYGVDLTGPDPARTEQARAEDDLTVARLLRDEHDADLVEDLRDGHIDDGPHEAATAEASAIAWDSAERRADRAEQLRRDGLEPQLQHVAMNADIAQARPATEAPAPGKGGRRHPKARKGRNWMRKIAGERQR